MPRPSIDEYYLSILERAATRATCARRKVAAILVDEKGSQPSTGYNGVPSGFPHCIDVPCPGANEPHGSTGLESTKCQAVHAEVNAILQCHRLDLAHTLYVTCTPCYRCALMLLNTNIERIVAFELYNDPDALAMLKRRGIDIWVVTLQGLPELK